MADKTRIEWTDATWNPVTGCAKVSPGCDNCYAETLANRFAGQKAWPNGFGLTLRPNVLEAPRRWSPRMIFVNSMSDLFWDQIPPDYRDQIFDVMEECTNHVFQILTKRPKQMRGYVSARYPHGAPPHMWFGVSIESNHFRFREDYLRETNVHVRFLSLEPLLGHIPGIELDSIDWVIVGGESGHRARPMDPGWVREIRDKCQDAGVPFFFKQWGGPNKKATGRVLDGMVHHEFPFTPAANAFFRSLLAAHINKHYGWGTFTEEEWNRRQEVAV